MLQEAFGLIVARINPKFADTLSFKTLEIDLCGKFFRIGTDGQQGKVDIRMDILLPFLQQFGDIIKWEIGRGDLDESEANICMIWESGESLGILTNDELSHIIGQEL